MKIQFYKNTSFQVEGAKTKIIFNPSENWNQSVDFALQSNQKNAREVSFESKKTLNLPGEFEISGILIKGFYTDKIGNIAFKVIIDEIVLAHFGDLTEIPNTNFFDQLGENIDIAMMNVSDDFDEKKVKELIGKIEPRIVVIGGEANYFPKIKENIGAKVWESPTFTIKKSGLPMDKTEVIMIPES